LHDHDFSYGSGVEASTAPIVFEAKVRGVSRKPTSQIVIQYSIFTRDLQFIVSKEGVHRAWIKVAALAYNNDGSILSHSVDDVTTHYNSAQMDEAQRMGVPVLQEITVARGAKFLMLSVVDMGTGRTGTVQLTVDSATQGVK